MSENKYIYSMRVKETITEWRASKWWQIWQDPITLVEREVWALKRIYLTEAEGLVIINLNEKSPIMTLLIKALSGNDGTLVYGIQLEIMPEQRLNYQKSHVV